MKLMKKLYMVTVCFARLLGIKTIHDFFHLFISSSCCVLKKSFFSCFRQKLSEVVIFFQNKKNDVFLNTAAA